MCAGNRCVPQGEAKRTCHRTHSCSQQCFSQRNPEPDAADLELGAYCPSLAGRPQCRAAARPPSGDEIGPGQHFRTPRSVARLARFDHYGIWTEVGVDSRTVATRRVYDAQSRARSRTQGGEGYENYKSGQISIYVIDLTPLTLSPPAHASDVCDVRSETARREVQVV